MSTLKAQIKRYLKFCFSFKGRLNRKAFFFSWLKLLGLAVVYGLITALMAILSKMLPIYLSIFTFLLIALCILGLITIFVGMIGIQIKRLHDLNFSGWWLLVAAIITAPGNLASDPRVDLSFPEPLGTILIAVYLIIFIGLMISLFFIKGSKGDNKYGKDPLKPSEA